MTTQLATPDSKAGDAPLVETVVKTRFGADDADEAYYAGYGYDDDAYDDDLLSGAYADTVPGGGGG